MTAGSENKKAAAGRPAKPGRRIVRFLLMLVISLVIGVTVFRWNAKTIGNNQMPMPFGTGMAVVLSGSMEPALHVDDLVIIQAADSYEPGDIVVFQSGNMMVIHRLVEIDDTTAITKGDANNVADDPIPVYMIKGKMVGHIEGIGSAVQVIKSPVVTLVILFAAVYLMILSGRGEQKAAQDETEQIRREIEKLKKEMES